MASIVGLELGQEVDVKKAKGTDGAVLEDNGISPAKFNIELRLSEALWPAFQEVLPKVDHRRPGGPRSPLEIVHPLTASLGIRQIVVRKVRPSMPTARGGMRWVFECLQWFPEPKPKRTSSTPQPATSTAMSFDDPAKLRAWELTQASHFELIGGGGREAGGANRDIEVDESAFEANSF